MGERVNKDEVETKGGDEGGKEGWGQRPRKMEKYRRREDTKEKRRMGGKGK